VSAPGPSYENPWCTPLVLTVTRLTARLTPERPLASTVPAASNFQRGGTAALQRPHSSALYRTIVADPPWDHSDGTGWDPGDADHRRRPEMPSRGQKRTTGLPYGTMSLEEIRALPVRTMAEDDAHLYLWTTNRYLRDAYGVADAWGFKVVKPLVWCKEPMGFMGRPYTSSAEFVLFCRRGNLKATTDAGRQWWVWPRTRHSAKPEAFLDLVEQVSPGPYLELFARRARFGWDYWGDQSLGTAQMEAA
jgi:N6-adenosine-specific RNA methylase IME4